MPGWDETRRCGNCLAFTEAPPIVLRKGETEEAARTRFINAGQALPKGTCRLFPKPEPKAEDDWCTAWEGEDRE
jgi:hypothetical protein